MTSSPRSLLFLPSLIVTAVWIGCSSSTPQPPIDTSGGPGVSEPGGTGSDAGDSFDAGSASDAATGGSSDGSASDATADSAAASDAGDASH